MAVSYKKLFHILIIRNISLAQFQKEAGYSANIFTCFRKDMYVSLASVEEICNFLNC
ncbi:MAG: helix-turn-helix transcriptional regulator [Eubacteriales bacterium]|nr:helix-turn-helix transcriptional regulator [Eubacteriales bacterium]